jgi:ATP adenylyltransferase
MESLFAPWRMAWVSQTDEQPTVNDCVFCEVPAAREDRENRVLLRGERAYVLLNRSPYMTGHVMILPYEHTEEYQSLPDETVREVSHLQQRSLRALEAALSPDGFNVGMNLGTAGGASVADHLHVHVVPRWDDDVSFMQMTGETSVIVEALDETYERLRTAFAGLDGVRERTPEAALEVEASA